MILGPGGDSESPRPGTGHKYSALGTQPPALPLLVAVTLPALAVIPWDALVALGHCSPDVEISASKWNLGDHPLLGLLWRLEGSAVVKQQEL